jgi:hypothetical protein
MSESAEEASKDESSGDRVTERVEGSVDRGEEGTLRASELVLESLDDLEDLDLDELGSGIVSLSIDFSKFHDGVESDLQDCFVKIWRTVKSLSSTLTSLSISHIFLKEDCLQLFWDGFFSSISLCTRIERIVLSHLSLIHLAENQILNANSLKELDLSHNKLSFLDFQFFSELENLQRLDLSHNHIKVFPESFDLSWFQDLSDIDIRFNPLEVIPSCFATAPETCSIHLSPVHPRDIYKRKSKLLDSSTDVSAMIDVTRSGHRVKKCRSDSFSKALLLSNKYRDKGILDSDDNLCDGFIDCGRSYDGSLNFKALEHIPVDYHGREFILVDKDSDQKLSTLLKHASDLIFEISDIHVRIKLLSIFVSDSMGGRRDNGDVSTSSLEHLIHASSYGIRNLKQLRKSNIIPIGSITLGVCRHRAILFKYLCDNVVPRIPCWLIRGYRLKCPHVWNMVSFAGIEYTIDTLDSPYSLLTSQVMPRFDYFPQMQSYSSNCVTSAKITCQEFAKGANAVIYVAHIGESLICAAKVTELDHLSPDSVWVAFRELSVLKALNHNNVVQYYGYSIQSYPLRLHVFMELIYGNNLSKVLSSSASPLSTFDSLILAYQIIDGIDYLHSNHVVHRDIKPDNILVSRLLDYSEESSDIYSKLRKIESRFSNSIVKVCDMSSCVVVSDSEQSQFELAGTLRWMAPEVLFCSKHQSYTTSCGCIRSWSRKVDIWSFGMVLYEMLSGKAPHSEATSEAYFNETNFMDSIVVPKDCMDLSNEAEEQSKTRKLMIQLMTKCIEMDPDKRPTALQVREQLEGFITQLSDSDCDNRVNSC